MPLPKPNQELHRDLKEAATTVKWAGVTCSVPQSACWSLVMSKAPRI
ncbi:hypothetical protein [Pseudomonas fragi]